MRSPVPTRLVPPRRPRGVHRDDKRETDVPGWLLDQRGEGMIWPHQANLPLTPASGSVTVLNHLQSIIARPARWTGGEPPQAVSTLLDALLGIAKELDEPVAYAV
jgi:hypothetical protein